jgi:hypothetical protein
MLYRKKIADIFQIHTKHINTLCVQNIETLNVIPVVHIFTSGFRRLNLGYKTRQLFLYRQVIAVFSHILQKHINTRYVQNVEFFKFILVLHIVTTGCGRLHLGY